MCGSAVHHLGGSGFEISKGERRPPPTQMKPCVSVLVVYIAVCIHVLVVLCSWSPKWHQVSNFRGTVPTYLEGNLMIRLLEARKRQCSSFQLECVCIPQAT